MRCSKQGIGALLSGKDHGYAASVKTKIEGMIFKGAMHEK